MHDFGQINLKGAKGVLKAHNCSITASCKITDNPAKTVKLRTFTIVGGSGCDPDPARSRVIELRTDAGLESCSSYDLEYVIVDGQRIYPIPPPPADAYVCGVDKHVEGANDIMPAPKAKVKLVKRKR